MALAVWYQFEVPRGLGGLPEQPLVPEPAYDASTQISSSGYAVPLVTQGVYAFAVQRIGNVRNRKC